MTSCLSGFSLKLAYRTPHQVGLVRLHCTILKVLTTKTATNYVKFASVWTCMVFTLLLLLDSIIRFSEISKHLYQWVRVSQSHNLFMCECVECESLCFSICVWLWINVWMTDGSSWNLYLLCIVLFKVDFSYIRNVIVAKQKLCSKIKYNYKVYFI